MATSSTAVLNEVAYQWDHNAGLASAVLSGIVGDDAHAASGGYHISIESQVNSNDYSIRLEKDKAPPGNWDRNKASAIDMSMNTVDMGTMWWRFYNVYVNRASDPRAQFIREAIGLNPTNGRAQRIDFANGTISDASDDHEWHWHLSLYRMYVNSWDMSVAVISVLKGQSLQDYLGPAPQPVEEDDEEMAKIIYAQGRGWARVTGSKVECVIEATDPEGQAKATANAKVWGNAITLTSTEWDLLSETYPQETPEA